MRAQGTDRSAEGAQDPQAAQDTAHDESPERLPLSAWIVLIGFAVFVIAFGTCASNFMFS